MADDLTSRPATAVYDEDFFAWTQIQSDALRRAGAGGALPPDVDWERLSEEVGDMGKRDLRGAMNLTRRILEHLYLLQASASPHPRNHWKVEIAAFRADLEGELTPTIRLRIEDSLDDLHRRAARLMRDKLKLEEPETPEPNASLRWTLAQILGEADDPIG
ncbi:MAG: DUF29 domain-containing protein [Alphaproteobacteria bacterium]|nr:DUF29 domain-containing protein [Alphaproteobacteria bacterium]